MAREQALQRPLQAFAQVWRAYNDGPWPILGAIATALLIDLVVAAVSTFIGGTDPFLSILAALLNYAIQMWTTGAVLRTALARASGPLPAPADTWAFDRRSWSFIGVMLVCGLAFLPFVLSIFLTTAAWGYPSPNLRGLLVAGIAASMTAGIYLQLRLFPAQILSAIGYPNAIKTAWNATGGRVFSTFQFHLFAFAPVLACALVAAMALVMAAAGAKPAMLLLLPLAPIAAYFIGLYVLGHAYWALQLVPWLGGAWQDPALDEGTELAPSPAPQPSKRRGSMESKTPAPKKRKIQSHTKRKTITAPKKRS
jgi:hypothetical protein